MQCAKSSLRKHEKLVDDLRSDNERLRKACSEMSSVPECVIKNQIRKAFSLTFTANQIDLILGVKKKVVWTNEEIAMAFSLR